MPMPWSVFISYSHEQLENAIDYCNHYEQRPHPDMLLLFLS
jgi:hypothetical protein